MSHLRLGPAARHDATLRHREVGVAAADVRTPQQSCRLAGPKRGCRVSRRASRLRTVPTSGERRGTHTGRGAAWASVLFRASLVIGVSLYMRSFTYRPLDGFISDSVIFLCKSRRDSNIFEIV